MNGVMVFIGKDTLFASVNRIKSIFFRAYVYFIFLSQKRTKFFPVLFIEIDVIRTDSETNANIFRFFSSCSFRLI